MIRAAAIALCLVACGDAESYQVPAAVSCAERRDCASCSLDTACGWCVDRAECVDVPSGASAVCGRPPLRLYEECAAAR